MFRFMADAHVEDDLDHGMQNMTTNVIAETYHVLRLTLGHDFDTLASVTVIVMLWQMLKQLRRQIEDMVFVQMSVGDELDSDVVGSNEDEDEDEGGRRRRRRGGGGRPPPPKHESNADTEMAECVRTYASSRVLETRSLIALLFPLPKLEVSADIDSSTTLSDEPGCESKELNAASEGVPLKTATIKPTLGATSVIVADGAPLLRLPFVWIAEGASDETVVDKLQRSMPSMLASGFRALFRRLGLLELQRTAQDGLRGYGGRGGGRGGGGGGGGGAASRLGAVDAKAADRSLILSTFAWNEALLARVIDDARAFSQRRRTRRCEVRKLGFKDQSSYRRGSDEDQSIYIDHVFDPRSDDYRELHWDVFEAPPRKLSSVFLPAEVELELCRGIDEFLRRRTWYVRRGFRYQQTYLLHGPPGNGKSSVMQALAAHYTVPLYILQLSGGQVDASACRAALRHTAKEPCIVAVEDAESCFVAKKKKGKKNKAGAAEDDEGSGERHKPITAKEFVELLTDDTEANPEGRILILTTNTVDLLDPALRAFLTDDGKFVEFPCASPDVMRRVWLNFYRTPDGAPALFDRFLAALDAVRASDARAAALQLGVSAYQGYLMQWRDDPDAAASAANVRAFVDKRLREKQQREERGEVEPLVDTAASPPGSAAAGVPPGQRAGRPGAAQQPVPAARQPGLGPAARRRLCTRRPRRRRSPCSTPLGAGRPRASHPARL